ncbi:hypothetical protein HRbin01_01499 [archaeon HR01]|nr:hypothetical protein HRbin01_01499 [archaeon HR01]
MPSKSSNIAKGLGPRYGSTLRKRWAEVVQSARSTHRCPKCESMRVRRVSVGIWMCRRCGLKFAGQAYSPGQRVV